MSEVKKKDIVNTEGTLDLDKLVEVLNNIRSEISGVASELDHEKFISGN